MKNKRNLNIKWLLLQNDQNADTTLLHSHDELSMTHQNSAKFTRFYAGSKAIT